MNPLTLLLALFASAVAAVVPTVLWVMLVWWCDRFEREPIPLLAATFLWGALPAAILALLAELLLGSLGFPQGQALASEILSSSTVVPLIEELAKASALVLLLLFWSGEIDDALDGLVYGALVGFGFAMTENFLYFAGAALQGDWAQWGGLVFLRGVVFGLNHAFYTALFGAALGFAHTSARGRARFMIPLLGFAAALLAHGIHNLGAALVPLVTSSILLSLASDAGGILLVAVMIGLAIGQERRWLRAELADEVGRLVTAGEYQVLLSLRSRWAMLAEARRTGGLRAFRKTGEFQQLATEYAFYKHRVHLRGIDARATQRLSQLAAQVAATRSALGWPAVEA